MRYSKITSDDSVTVQVENIHSKPVLISVKIALMKQCA